MMATHADPDRVATILRHGAELGLGELAERLAATRWSADHCLTYLDRVRPAGATQAPGAGGDDFEALAARFRIREGRPADGEPAQATTTRAAVPVAADGDVEALLLRFRAREGRTDAEVATVASTRPRRPTAPVTDDDDLEALVRRARARDGRT